MRDHCEQSTKAVKGEEGGIRESDDNGEWTRGRGEFTKERVNGSTVRQMVGARSSRDLRTPFPLLFPNDEGRSVPVTPRKISSIEKTI